MTAAGSLVARHGNRFTGQSEEQVAEIRLIDEAGKPATLGQWTGKVVLLDFIYTGCGDICPLRTAQIAAVQSRLSPKLQQHVQFISVSVDPEHDDPPALRAYAARNGADLSNWTFLTGSLNAIARFGASFALPPSTAVDPPTHVTTVYLLDEHGRTVQLYTGDEVDENRLISDIAKAVADS